MDHCFISCVCYVYTSQVHHNGKCPNENFNHVLMSDFSLLDDNYSSVFLFGL